MNFKFKKISSSDINTTIAVALTVIFSKVFKFESPYYVALVALVTMQGTKKDSIMLAAKERAYGTIIGVLIGFICASIKTYNFIIISIGIIAVIFICNTLSLSNSINISGIAFLSITLNIQDKMPLIYSFNRLLEAFFSIGISIAVTYSSYFFKKHLR